ncbi:hypothetical protein K1719_010387 [Acacia pycnantha]|nr:hypothetical protein K1719_010387 [Acacia pycnantha]
MVNREEVEKVQKVGLPRQQQSKRTTGSKSDFSKGLGEVRNSKSDVQTKEGKREKVGKGRDPLATINGSSAGGIQRESQLVQGSVDFVLESNPEMYKWQELNMVEKENLHPGDYSEQKYGYGSLDTGGMQTDSIEEDLITSFSSNKEVECGDLGLVAMRVIPKVGSDHHPIVVKLNVDYVRRSARPLRYQVAWQLHEKFEEVIKDNWKGEEELNVKLSTLQQNLTQWNNEVFVYKGLTKLIVNRLKPFMDKWISPYQSSFVPKRSIHDNIIIAKEVVHSMSR